MTAGFPDTACSVFNALFVIITSCFQMKKCTMIFLLTVILGISVRGQWSDNPAINNAIALLTGEQAIPKIATCPNGDTYIGFFSNESGNYNVKLQRLDSQGNPLWADNGILISNQPSMTWLTDWDMAADINNHCILTWQDIRNGNNNTYAYRISPEGNFVWGADGIALSNNSAFNAAPKVVTTPAGNAVFAWTSDNVIIMQKISPAGTKQWGDNGITLSSANTMNWPQMLPVGSDDIILKYFEDSGPPNAPTRHVFAQRYNSSGNPVWAAPSVISDAGGISAWTQIFPFINDGSDGFYIAWHDDRDNNMTASVWVNHVDASGVVQFPANGVEASTAATFNHFYPYLACPPGSQDVYVFWNEMNGLQSMRGIFGQKLSATGTRQWGNNGMTFIPLSATTYTPLEARNTPTDMIVLYEEGLSATTGMLKAMRIGTDGSLVWPDGHVIISSAASSKVHTVINEFQDNQWIISWEDNRNGPADIYAQNLLLDGNLGFWDPQFGNIQGQVTLNGGTGNVTQVVITAGNESTLPDPTGFYFLEVPTGTYTVTATLAGYYPGSVGNVVVLQDQTTSGVDFVLDPVPTTGYIQGIVSLDGGSGEITEAVVSTGGFSTNPDATGFYSLEAPVGVWDVEASLGGYTGQVRAGIVVNPGIITPDVDFMLAPAPTTGFAQGYVTIEGGYYDVTEVTVSAGNQTTHPSSNGFWFLELPVGNHDITAIHNWTPGVTVENVEIEPGVSTTGIDFLLVPFRTDIIVKALDQHGNPVFPCSIQLTGPGPSYHTAMLTEDSVTIANAVYGNYHGTSINVPGGTAEADTLIDQSNNYMIFHYYITATTGQITDFSLSVLPNPVTEDSRIILKSGNAGEYTFRFYKATGEVVSSVTTGQKTAGTHEWPFTFISGNRRPGPGIYYLELNDGNGSATVKVLIP